MGTERFFETPESQDAAPFASKIGTFGGNLFIPESDSLEEGKPANLYKMVAGLGILSLAVVVSFVELPVNRAVKRGIQKLQGRQ